MGGRGEALKQWLGRPDGRRRFTETVSGLMDGFDVERWRAQAAAYGETVIRNIDFELAGRRFQEADGKHMDRDQLAAVFAQAAAAVQEFLTVQSGLYRESLRPD